MEQQNRDLKTVHIVFNSHIDPVWLWPWQSGLDATINTCRSVCNLLQRHGDVIFTSGEAWKYWQVQRIDPGLFARIEALVKKGQWEIIGGWWIQADCNQPSGRGLAQQIALGREYFERTLGCFPRIGYNVDSFGHAATLPRIMRAAGQDRYIMMRPQEREMSLPARLFRWRGYAEDGADKEVLTYRLAGYASGANAWSIQDALSQLPEGVTHTMCLMGLGDHGGGPNEKLVQWVREQAGAIDGVRLVFSSPSRFFAAVEPQIARVPLVTGELQMHAVGCYSVCRPVKVMVRKAEHLLRQAEVMLGEQPAQADEDRSRSELQEGWRQVCFHHFHDTLGGTCIPSAYAQAEAQLGRAVALADDVLQVAMRRHCVGLPQDKRARLVVCNASDQPFSGAVSFDISMWPDFMAWQRGYRLVDGQTEIPYQLSEPEAAVPDWQMVRVIWRMELAAGEVRPVFVDRTTPPQAIAGGSGLVVAVDQIANSHGAEVRLGDSAGIRVGGLSLSLPRLDLIADTSDTWSHDVNRYPKGPSEAARWGNAALVDSGPLLVTLIQRGCIGQSKLQAEWRVLDADGFVELILRVNWVEEFKILKLTLPLPAPAVRRWDGIPGGVLERSLDAVERPVRDLLLVELQDGQKLGVACPDVYAADADAQSVRLTLLRSPLMAHHSLMPNLAPRGVFADRGEHVFRFRFMAGAGLTAGQVDAQALMMIRPPLVAEWTDGMPW